MQESKKRLATRYFPTLLNVVSSPQRTLTAVFGMETGVTSSRVSPTKNKRLLQRFFRKISLNKSTVCFLFILRTKTTHMLAHGSQSKKKWRPGHTAYQKQSGEILADLTPLPCQPDGLSGAFRSLTTWDG